MKLHLGSRNIFGVIRLLTGVVARHGEPDEYWYAEHPIRRLYGVSGANGRWFLGLIVTGDAKDVFTSAPAPD